MAFLENFIPVTILTSLSLSLLFSSFFSNKAANSEKKSFSCDLLDLRPILFY